jgi:hypothetical protein
MRKNLESFIPTVVTSLGADDHAQAGSLEKLSERLYELGKWASLNTLSRDRPRRLYFRIAPPNEMTQFR